MLTVLITLIPMAIAGDEHEPDQPGGCPECLYEELTQDWRAEKDASLPEERMNLVGAAGMVYFPDSPSPWAKVELRDRRHHYARVEGRVTPHGEWMGRGGLGVDLFGNQPTFDLTLGLYAGSAAVWNERHERTVQIGTEVGLGVQIDRTHADVRWLGGTNPQTQTFRRETVWTLGYRIAKPIELQAHAVTLRSGSPTVPSQSGLGLAGALIF